MSHRDSPKRYRSERPFSRVPPYRPKQPELPEATFNPKVAGSRPAAAHRDRRRTLLDLPPAGLLTPQQRREPQMGRKWMPRKIRTLVPAALVALAALMLVGAASGARSKSPARSTTAQANQLEVFSWWTGGGEAHGLQKLITIWNANHKGTPFKNETVAGGAGSNA